MTDKPVSPYLPFGSFVSLCDSLANTTLPDDIDRSMLPKLSGAGQSAMLAALRFLALIKNDGAVTDHFRQLIEARRRGDWKARLAELVEKRYAGVIGDINVQTTSHGKLEDAFKASGVSQGQMVQKSIRFYLKALKEADVEISPHLKVRRAGLRRGKKKTAKKTVGKKSTKNKGGDGGKTDTTLTQTNGDEPKAGFERVPLLGGLGFIEFKTPATEQTCKVIEGAAAYLRVGLTTKKGAKP